MWLNIPEAAKHAGVCRSTIGRWMKDGLTFYRLNRNTVRIHPNDIDKFIKRFKAGVDVDAEVREITGRIKKGK